MHLFDPLYIGGCACSQPRRNNQPFRLLENFIDAKVEAEQRAKDEEAVADRVKAAISQGEITAITAAEFDLLCAGAAAASC